MGAFKSQASNAASSTTGVCVPVSAIQISPKDRSGGLSDCRRHFGNKWGIIDPLATIRASENVPAEPIDRD
jgi:hypothetical protein